MLPGIRSGQDARLFQPSLTAITMFDYVPALLLLSKVAHYGLLEIAKTTVRPDVSVARA